MKKHDQFWFISMKQIQASFFRLTSFFTTALAVLIASCSLMIIGVLAPTPAGAVNHSCVLLSAGVCTDTTAQITMTFSGTTATVSGVSMSPAANVVVPSSITVGGVSYSVTSIASYAFRYDMAITTLSVPRSVTTIGDYAFEGAIALTSVNIAYATIGTASFYQCGSLTSLSVNGPSIGLDAFYDVGHLNSATIGSSIIGSHAFIYASIDNLTLLSSVSTIEDYAFYESTIVSISTPGNTVVWHSDGSIYPTAQLTQPLVSFNSATATWTSTSGSVISQLGVLGVSAPVAGATPVTTITNAQYTGTVSWSNDPSVFLPGVAYVAYITLTPLSGYSSTGLAANSFSVANASSVTNAVNSTFLTATFPMYLCTSGTYFDGSGCVSAAPGTYSAGGALTSATNCPIGYYQPNAGQSSCLPADVGYYVAFVGAASEVAAPIGSYVSVTGSSAPTPCPSGSTTSSTGQSACVIVVPPIVYSKPTSPSNVTASMSNGTATVSFSPGSSGNLPTYNQIDMYINGVLAGNVCNVSGASSCPISNLGPDVSFSFTVTAINSKGSAASALSNSVSYASPSFAMPTTTTTTTTVPPVIKTITCVKGASSKKVTALNPVCPAGYKKK